jgi:hypothetical protein
MGTVTQIGGLTQDQLIAFAFIGLFVLVGLVILIAAVGRSRAWWRLKGSEASAPSSLDTGHEEVQGTARPLERTLTSPREQATSLVYEHEIEERRIDHDPDGGTQREWRTIKDETSSVPFVIEGEHGEAVVDPEGATNLLETSVSTRHGDRRITIKRLDVGEPVYVAGEVVRAGEADVPTDGQRHVVRGPSTWIPNALRRLYEPPFVLSDAKEGTAERRLLWSGAKLLGFAVLWLGITGAIAVAILSETGALGSV